MAAGFSLTQEQIPAFKQFVGEYVLAQLGTEKITPVLNIDCSVNAAAVNVAFAQQLEQLEPYGTGNPEPLIKISDVQISRPQIVGNGHVKCFLTSALGGYVPAIAFNAADNQIGQAVLNHHGDIYDVVGTVKTDVWQGNVKVQLVIKDMMRK